MSKWVRLVYKDHAVAKLERKKGDVGPNCMLVVLHLLIQPWRGVLSLWIQSNKGYMKRPYIFTISFFSSSFKIFMCMGSEKPLKQFIYNSYTSPCVWFSIPSMTGCNLFKYGRFACILWLRKVQFLWINAFSLTKYSQGLLVAPSSPFTPGSPFNPTSPFGPGTPCGPAKQHSCNK